MTFESGERAIERVLTAVHTCRSQLRQGVRDPQNLVERDPLTLRVRLGPKRVTIRES